MYKYIGLIALTLLSINAYATTWTTENCTNRGGTIIEATNGAPFCLSNVAMNWWSANAWCHHHGGMLAKLTTICPGTPLSSGASCPNVQAYNEVYLGAALVTGSGQIKPAHSGANGGIWFEDITGRRQALCE